MKSNLRKNKNGFTILEAIISIVLLGFVVAIASPSILNALANASEKKREIVVANISAAKDLFEATASAAEIAEFNEDRGGVDETNIYRFGMLRDRNLLTAFSQTVSSMSQICEGTGHTRVIINTLDEKPYF